MKKKKAQRHFIECWDIKNWVATYYRKNDLLWRKKKIPHVKSNRIYTDDQIKVSQRTVATDLSLFDFENIAQILKQMSVYL